MRAWLVIALCVAACGKKEEAAPAGSASDQRPPPIPAAERQRGDDACKAYIARACACAKAHPDKAEVAKKCQLDASLVDALGLAMGVDDEANAAPEDLFRAQGEIRKITATCIEGVNWLTSQGCPP